MLRRAGTIVRAGLAPLLVAATAAAQRAPPADVPARAVRAIEPRVLTAAEGDPAGALDRHARDRLRAANLRESKAWTEVRSAEDWARFRDPRLAALRDSLNPLPRPGTAPRVLVTGRHDGDGYVVENVVYESRPGGVVAANLYRPAAPAGLSPAILIAHSHHNPKTQGELQDMGMTWARAGVVVLVPDLPGHGERRDHPFRSASDHAGPFRVGRQDYYFRANAGVQLAVAGESLMGWMVRDLIKGVDLLVARPDVDPARVILLGSVAGGGDPAGVTAALDDRIAAVAPFNFGGPQPDYPIPADPEANFEFFGVPSWESTRCLAGGAAGGFAHWLIVGSVAPRRLIYAHEFAWDRDRDPAWPRIRTVYSMLGVPERLAVTTGRGTLKGTPPESSHCNNIGPLHRVAIHEALARWFGLPVPAEFSARRPDAELMALTDDARRALSPKPLHALAAEAADLRSIAMREALASLRPAARRDAIRRVWSDWPGGLEPERDPEVIRSTTETTPFGRADRVVLRVEGDLLVPVLVLRPDRPRPPVVVAVAQEGKARILAERAGEIAGWLAGGAAVCLVDVRGTGETARASESRRYNGGATTRSDMEWLLGGTLLGARVRDVRSVLRHLRSRPDLDARTLALWGDSFAPTNPPGDGDAVPMDAEPAPALAEPMGDLVSLLTAMSEDDVRAVATRGGLVSYRSLLDTPFVHVPHDAITPRAIAAGDLTTVIEAIAPRPVRRSGLVDGRNRAVAPATDAASDARELLARLGPDDPPARKVDLFNGKDLDGLRTWLRDTRGDDPRKVFRVEDGILHISGDGFGYVGTTRPYRDYRVVVEYRWGDRTDGGKFVRNSGLLLHANGPDGNAGGTWMASVECQLAQGCVGDLIPIPGKDADGAPLPVRFKSPVKLGPDRRPRWSEGGELREFTRGQLWWSRHDPDFEELLDTRGKDDVESPKGDWTRVECVCKGDTITVIVNGTTVNRCEAASPASGRILLQTEGFELFVRRFELHPLD